MHDFNGGILPSGLFWTLDMRRSRVDFHRSGRRAVLTVRDLAVVDSFQFFGPNQVPASVSFRIEWRASAPFERRGSGNAVPPEDPAAFVGDIAPARSTIRCSGEEWGFAFGSGLAGVDRGHAQIGRSRNGVFL